MRVCVCSTFDWGKQCAYHEAVSRAIEIRCQLHAIVSFVCTRNAHRHIHNVIPFSYPAMRNLFRTIFDLGRFCVLSNTNIISLILGAPKISLYTKVFTEKFHCQNAIRNGIAYSLCVRSDMLQAR